MNKQERIYQECTKFRQAIEEMKNELGIKWFEDFPCGCCSDTSLMLAQYLYDNGFGVATHVSGEYRGSHAWLELDGLTIDITADQFEHVEQKVIVENKSSFHTIYENEEIERIAYNQLLTGRNIGDVALFKAYRIIRQRIENHHYIQETRNEMNKESTKDKKLMHPVYGNGVITNIEEGEAGYMVKAIFEGTGEKEFLSMVNPLEEKH